MATNMDRQPLYHGLILLECRYFLLINLLFVFLLTGHVQSELLFEAAFQGECRKSSPCQQLCFDLHDGTFECACHQGYHLDLNGYSCLTNGTEMKPNFIPNTTNNDQTSHMVEELSLSSRIANQQNLYSCSDIECEAGGICIESELHQEHPVRCRCPLGRGGQFCEKILEVKRPRFSGTSYLALPTLRNAHRSLQIILEFKPEVFEGVLLYSGQEPGLEGDFVAIVISQGFIEFRFDCGMGEGIIRSDLPIILNAWNTVRVYRDGRNAWMQLNQGKQLFGHSKGLFSRITFHLETFLGGSPNISQIADRVNTNKGLVGCVRLLQINDRSYDFNSDPIDGFDIDQCNFDACNSVSCLNGGHCVTTEYDQKQCICLLGFTGEFCEIETEFLIPSFNGSSYLQFFGFGSTSVMFSELLMVIKPTEPNGLFLYNGQRMDRTGDFISLNLIDGYVEFRFDLGSGAAIIRSPERIELNKWHTIYASRTGREGILKVDEQPATIGTSLGAFTQLSLPLNLFVGGVSSLQDTHQNVQSTQLFHGCIQRVVLNGRSLSLKEDVLSGNRVADCEHSCNQKPCENSGLCEPLLEHYQCHCIANYIGSHCQRDIGSSAPLPMFYGNSFLKFTNHTIINSIGGFETIISFNMRAFSSNGLIFWIGASTRGDYLAIGLQEGHLTVDINLGSGSYRISANLTRIDDGQWHQVNFSRYGKQLSIRVDQDTALQASLNGSTRQLNVKSALFLGGLEDPTLLTNSLYSKGFIGCISNMTLGHTLQMDMLSQAEKGVNIRTCI